LEGEWEGKGASLVLGRSGISDSPPGLPPTLPWLGEGAHLLAVPQVASTDTMLGEGVFITAR